MAKLRSARPRPVRSARSEPLAAALPRPAASPPHAVHTQKEAALQEAHRQAVGAYEEGVAALQAHDFARAASLLRSVLSRFPEERELHERVRLYLNVCERYMAPRAVSPSTPEERVFAATLAVNAGRYDEAVTHLRTVRSEVPDHDHALYMLASVLALRDEADEAVPLLLRAIELNPDNRTLARHDPDLDALRRYEAVRAALEAAVPAKADRRKAPRRAR